MTMLRSRDHCDTTIRILAAVGNPNTMARISKDTLLVEAGKQPPAIHASVLLRRRDGSRQHSFLSPASTEENRLLSCLPGS